MELINIYVEKHVGTIAFNNEKALNSFDNSMLNDFYNALDLLNEDLNVRVILIKGSDKFFSAGDNLKGMATKEYPDPRNTFDKYHDGYPKVIKKIRSLNKPTISLIKKFAYGAAFEIVLASDFAYATSDTKFGLPFVKRGIASGTSLILDYVDYKKAADILFTGRDIDTEEACNCGYINSFGTENKIQREVEDLIEILTQLPTETIGLIKRSLNNNVSKSLEERFIDQCLHTSLSSTTSDFLEGHRSFYEKREPIFNRGEDNDY